MIECSYHGATSRFPVPSWSPFVRGKAAQQMSSMCMMTKIIIMTWKVLVKEELFLFYDALNTFYLRLYAMASDIWLRTILIVREETRCHHIGYSFRLTARVIFYAPSNRQDSTYHGLCYTSRGALAGKRNSSVGSPHEGSIRRPIAPWANALTTELHLAPVLVMKIQTSGE